MNLTNIQLDNQKKILIVIFFVLIVYLDASFILKAQIRGLKSLDSKIVRLNTDLANLNHGLENMRLSKSKPGTLEPRKVVKASKVLSESQISELLQEISSAANKFDIKISQMRPNRQAQKEKSDVLPDKLIPILVNLEMICDYHSLGRFIQALESSSVFMEVQELEISTQLPDYMKQKVTLVVKTYVTK
jgi:Tfp pilus assembly protein PilO